MQVLVSDLDIFIIPVERVGDGSRAPIRIMRHVDCITVLPDGGQTSKPR